MLSAGPTPRVPLDRWEFAITTETGERHTLVVGRSCSALPGREPTVDIHCVTKWSKLGTDLARACRWTSLLDDVETAADYALVHSYGGYTTNLPLEDLLDGKAWIAYRYDGEDLRGRARRPGPAARAAPVPLEVRQVGARHRADAGGRARLLGERRLPRLR